MKENLVDADTLLCHAKAIMTKPTYTREDSARVDGLIRMAQVLQGRSLPTDDSEEFRAVSEIIRYGSTNRDMSLGTLTASTATSVFSHQLFLGKLSQALKAYDALFDPEVVTLYQPTPALR